MGRYTKTEVSELMTFNNNSVGYNAVLLAATRSAFDENAVKEILQKQGYKVAVTEIGGKSDGDFQMKINKAVIGACLNEGIIEKTEWEVHALLHAAEEAKKGVLVNAASSTSLALKIAIVRRERWIAVGLFGESCIHFLTGHDRCGLGVMHI